MLFRSATLAFFGIVFPAGAAGALGAAAAAGAFPVMPERTCVPAVGALISIAFPHWDKATGSPVRAVAILP